MPALSKQPIDNRIARIVEEMGKGFKDSKKQDLLYLPWYIVISQSGTHRFIYYCTGTYGCDSVTREPILQSKLTVALERDVGTDKGRGKILLRSSRTELILEHLLAVQNGKYDTVSSNPRKFIRQLRSDSFEDKIDYLLELPDIDSKVISKLNAIRHYRNQIAHSPISGFPSILADSRPYTEKTTIYSANAPSSYLEYFRLCDSVDETLHDIYMSKQEAVINHLYAIATRS